MNDHDLLLAIQGLLDGVEWHSDTLDEIASLLNDSGYRVRDLGGNDLPSSAADVAAGMCAILPTRPETTARLSRGALTKEDGK